jgi:hypothetical protein
LEYKKKEVVLGEEEVGVDCSIVTWFVFIIFYLSNIDVRCGKRSAAAPECVTKRFRSDTSSCFHSLKIRRKKGARSSLFLSLSVFVYLYPVSRKKQGATQKNIFIEEEEEVEEPLGREFVRSHPLKSAPLRQKKRLVYMLCEKERSAIGADTIKSAGFI